MTKLELWMYLLVEAIASLVFEKGSYLGYEEMEMERNILDS